jgi:hypothetical protein
MEALEDLSPGYFSSVSSYTQSLPWQRCFVAGLVYQGIGEREHEIAWQYFSQALEFAQHLRKDLIHASDRRTFFENADIGRLINSLVRSLLTGSSNSTTRNAQMTGVHTKIEPSVFTAFQGASGK